MRRNFGSKNVTSETTVYHIPIAGHIVRRVTIALGLLLSFTMKENFVQVGQRQFGDYRPEVRLVHMFVDQTATAVRSHEITKLPDTSPDLQDRVMGLGR